jgi:peptide/nickel transport system ATP-binding protein
MSEASPALLAAKDITVTFGAGALAFDAVRAAAVEVAAGQAIGIVGESGSGKTTLARVLVGLQRPTRGAVFLEGKQVFGSGGANGANGSANFPRSERWKVQMIFQDPYSSLNPRMKAWHGVAEAIQVWRKLPGREAKGEAFRLLNSVGISNQQAEHFPRSLSGGQLQRVSVARALAPNPKILIADEPTSSIDQSAQAQLLNLLHSLQQERGLTIVFISHDLGLIRYLTSGVYVMQKGTIVESGDPGQVFERPEHPYTQLLIGSIPGRTPSPGLSRSRAPT